MNGPRARVDELWMAWASKVFPVPVSPSSTTGTSDLAASAASWRQRAIASLLVVRSSSLNLDGRACMNGLLPDVFAQLADRLERILNQRPAADNDVRVALHSNAQGKRAPRGCRHFVAIE